MGAIFGIVGEGSLAEVAAMGARMPHRGAYQHAWSPAPGVYFGERSQAALGAQGALAVDLQADDFGRSELEARLEPGAIGLAGVNAHFSLAHWNAREAALLLAVDAQGFKSLYYTRLPGRLAFASEYKALLALTDLPVSIERDSVQTYLSTLHFRFGHPLLASVRSLPPGSYCELRGHELAQGNHWQPLSRPVERSSAEHARLVRETLLAVVSRQSGKFPRVGMALSGGLDSAGLLAVMRCVRPDLPVDSFTIGFGDDDIEILGGRELAAAFGTEHRELLFDPDCVAAALPRLVWLMEDITSREEALLQQLVLEAAGRARVPVVFGAYAADSLFAGMPRHKLLRWRELFPPLARPLTEIFHLTQSGAEPTSLLGRAGKQMLFGAEWLAPPAVIGASGSLPLHDPGSLDQYIADEICGAFDSGYLEPTLEAGGVEFRDPFQSLELMELALTIPGKLDVTLRRQKGILRDALSDLLPDAIRNRVKSIQRARHDTRLSDALDSMADDLLAPAVLRERGLVEPSYVETLRRRARGAPYPTQHLYHLWTLIQLELWCRIFLDRRGAFEAAR
jgi:asparagine synthase (glutamine-hydrolysing)